MASVNKVGESVEILPDNATNPASLTDFIDIICSYGDETDKGVTTEYVQISLDNIRGWRFGTAYANPVGPLLEINGVDVSAFTAAEKVAFLQNAVFVSGETSGSALGISDTTMHEGQFTQINVLTDTVFDVSDAQATIRINDDGTAQSMTWMSGVTYSAGAVIQGVFTQIQLVSGAVDALSNL